MAGNIQLVKAAVVASVRFARVYPKLFGIAVVVYAVSAVVSVRYLAPLVPQNYTGSQVSSWAGSLPQTILLAPVWTALLRFVILREKGRSYLKWDHRVRRVLLVTVIMSAILTAGGVMFALSLDVLPRFPVRLLIARSALVITLIAKIASWWLVMRLAIAPALAAAGTRRYALDTAFSFSRRWLGTVFAVKFLIYAPLFALIGGIIILTGGFHADQQAVAALLARPLSVAVVTLTTALAEFIDAAAMALVAIRIVRARKAEDEDGSMS